MTRTRADLKVVAAEAGPKAASQRQAAAGAPPAGATQRIVESITEAIVARRLMPGTKLAEQKIADIFKVSRTLVRQALNQLSRDRLVTLEAARGAFVAMPSVEEAHQVFELRQMIEAAMVKRLCKLISDAQIAAYLEKEKPYDCAGSAKSESLGIALMERMDSADPTALICLPLMALTKSY